jgi:hypothetical protein
MRPAVSFPAVLVTAVAVACASCSLPPSAAPTQGLSPSQVNGTTAPATSAGQLVLPTATPVTPPSSNAGAPGRAPSIAPPPNTTPATYADPATVARAWLQQWCQTDYQEPINAHVARAAVFATPAATAADTATGDTPDSYQQMRQQQVSSRCDDIAAQVDPEAPASPTQVYVQVSASRTQLAAGAPFQTMPFSAMRRVVRGGGGRWLVDIAVDAG